MLDFNLVNECLKCFPVLVGCFIACLFFITICLCALLLEKVYCSFTNRKHLEQLNNVNSVLKELGVNKNENSRKIF